MNQLELLKSSAGGFVVFIGIIIFIYFAIASILIPININRIAESTKQILKEIKELKKH